MRKSLLAAVIIGVLSVPAWAQESSWNNLKQLKVGDRIKVVETNLKTLEGKFVRFTDSELVLLVDKQETVIPKNSVYRVTRKGRGRNALIGLAVGAGAGLAVGVVATLPLQNEGKNVSGIVAGTTLGAAALGVAVGAGAPHEKGVFRAEKK